MNWRIPLADLDYGAEEEDAVLRVLRGKWLTMGAETKEFETRFAEAVGAKHSVAVSNATVALHLACLALSIGTGDEVIVPSLTFVATANAVLYTGAQVRFAEIHGPDDLTLSPRAIEALITPDTKAIMVMHYGGYPCAMEKIMAIANRHGLAVIEDAAHAPGASLHGRALGTWGDVGCFSFFSNKNLSTGEGGMLVTQRDDIAERARLLRSHGMTSLTWDRHQGHAYSYDVVALGYNYRMDEIRAALGLVQLSKLSANNARRGAITEQYWQALEQTGVGLPFRDTVGEPAYHIFPILLPEGVDRYHFIDHMRAAGVQTSIHYPPIHQFQAYRALYPDLELPVTEVVASREVTLPLYPTMTDEQVQLVVNAVKQGIQ
ncbi:MAG TPA: DegT/DnrJ/EryC1/StrS family aminotransferase [Anaerolineales bacterium]|nr:DegT/DnrJ/EryC1/StrS family aminotransferase [Anaerolineales bacterium]